METGLSGLNEVTIDGSHDEVLAAVAQPRPDRVLVIGEAFRRGLGIEKIYAACRYDRWFLEQIRALIEVEEDVKTGGLPGDAPALLRLKSLGFSDQRLAELTGKTAAEVAHRRRLLGVAPVYKRVDTCAAEFPANTAYMYSTYENEFGRAAECEAWPSEQTKVVILGGGPNRIGQGIEFDYCCVHAAYALKEAGYEAIMVNCNPETVSTDYDTSDRLYFEPLTDEDVIELIRAEQQNGHLLGVIVQLGGQTPSSSRMRSPRPAYRFSVPPPTPSTWPRTGSVSRRFCIAWICGSPPTGLRYLPRRRGKWQQRSDFRLLSDRPTCSAGAPWTSCTSRTTLIVISSG